MKWLLIAFAGLLVVALTACTQPVRLMYPDGQTVECESGWQPYGSIGSAIEQQRQGQCVHDHMLQGARRL